MGSRDARVGASVTYGASPASSLLANHPSGTALKAGDLIAFRTKGLYACIIRFGQRLGTLGTIRFIYHAIRAIFKGWPEWLEFCEYTHIAYVTEVLKNGDAKIVQAVRHVDEVLLSSYAGIVHLIIPYPEAKGNLKAGVGFGRSMVGMDYGLLIVFFRALNEITPKWVRINAERKGRPDCSVLGARAWEHMGFAFDRDIDVWMLSPSDEVKMFHRPLELANA